MICQPNHFQFVKALYTYYMVLRRVNGEEKTMWTRKSDLQQIITSPIFIYRAFKWYHYNFKFILQLYSTSVYYIYIKYYLSHFMIFIIIVSRKISHNKFLHILH